MAQLRILTIDDEEHILELLRYTLEKNGDLVFQALDGEKGLEILDREAVDLVLLDLMLPGMDGLEVLRRIRSHPRHGNVPVIMLTARNEEIDTVLGLEMGADDYMGKPFGARELQARIKTVLRRTQPQEPKEQEKEPGEKETVAAYKDLRMDREKREVLLRGELLELPLKEFELLFLLLKNRGRVFDREQLLEKIWGYEYYGETRTVDVHIRNLRKKIELDDAHPEYIRTVRGVGYKIG
ncbi:winged helix-turn-helix domain-containing protein [Anaerotalea alkaliphila]|uniref:Stage 0 sporulation protein A homolog n=1 Tax=Anaerotalea alkaliphila TaxID=2662126 RepID=A0A7X5KN84_9FIRM|nr:response regulator transcription factor [Anaerotalea alkaliphila]NDL67769.1 response regulator transcription factor [Anaerotalea alkaliphila]